MSCNHEWETETRISKKVRNCQNCGERQEKRMGNSNMGESKWY